MTIRWPLKPMLLLFVVLLPAEAACEWLINGDRTFLLRYPPAAVIALLIVWRRGAIQLTTSGLSRWGLHRTKTAEWTSIRAITFQRNRLSGYPVLQLHSGEQIKLKELWGFPLGPGYAEAAHRQIEAWWRDHRVPIEQAPPAPAYQPPIDPSVDPWQPPAV